TPVSKTAPMATWSNLTFPSTMLLKKTTAALQDQGFGVLTTIEVDKALKNKLDVDRDRYTILGACSPAYANQALDVDIDIGLLLPCNVVVRQKDNRTSVTFVDPHDMLAAAGESPDLQRLASEIKTHLDAAAQPLASGTDQ